jgi:hypothetical protein
VHSNFSARQIPFDIFSFSNASDGSEGEIMFDVQNNTGALIAEETKGALRALDNAILNELRLCATLMEAFEETQLPISSSQKLLQSMASGINHIVAGRNEMATTVRHLRAIKAGSTLAPVNYNCPEGVPSVALAEQPEVFVEPKAPVEKFVA